MKALPDSRSCLPAKPLRYLNHKQHVPDLDWYQRDDAVRTKLHYFAVPECEHSLIIFCMRRCILAELMYFLRDKWHRFVPDSYGAHVQGDAWSIPAVARSHDASLYSARSSRHAASGHDSGGQPAYQQPDLHADWRAHSRSATFGVL